MKLSLSLLAWSALSLCSSVTSASADKQQQQQLSPRQVKLHSLASKNNGIVPLTSQLYDELIQDTPSNPRDYSASIILTALNPKFGCQPCVGFDKEHKEVAKQWWNRPENRKDKANQMRHVFAVLDFEKGQDIFKRVSELRLCLNACDPRLTRCNDMSFKLGLSTAPLGQLFLPNTAQPLQYDFNKL